MGLAYLKECRYQEAIETLQEAIQINLKLPGAARGRHQGAMEHCKISMEIDLDKAKASYFLALSYVLSKAVSGSRESS